MEKTLADLIARLPIPGLKESANRHTIAEIISKELLITIQPKQISIKDSILTISVPPIVKTALHLHEIALKEAFKKEGITIQSIK